MKRVKTLFIILNILRLFPHIFIIYFLKDKKIIYEVKLWSKVYYNNFITLMVFRPAFRNLFYFRIRKNFPIAFFLLKFLCKPLNTLYITTEEIGEGLLLQHAFSTIISAKKIGKNCKINQQVTIGYSNATDAPTIGDNVTVYAGAKIIGGVNAVVVKDIPSNCTVVDVPAYIIKQDGEKITKKL